MAQKIEEVVLTLDLSVQDINAVLAALAKQPLENVVATWAKIKQSAEAQLAELDIEQPAQGAAND